MSNNRSEVQFESAQPGQGNTPEQKREQAEREKTKASFEGLDFANFYAISRGWVKGSWQRLDKADKEQYEEEDSKQGRLEVNGTLRESLFEPGLYRKMPDLKDYNIRVTKSPDGTYTAYPTQQGLFNFKEAYGDVMDLLAARGGISSLTIEWKNANYVSIDRLKELIALAKERGLEVEFGPKVQEYLDKKDPSVWAEIRALQIDCNNHAKSIQEQMNLHKADRFKQLAQNINKEGKTEGATLEEKKTNYKEELKQLMTGPQPKGIEALQKEVNVIESRLGKLDKAQTELQNHIDAYGEAQEKKEKFAGLSDDKIQSLWEHNAVPRDDLLEAMKKERAELDMRKSVCSEHITEVKKEKHHVQRVDELPADDRVDVNKLYAKKDPDGSIDYVVKGQDGALHKGKIAVAQRAGRLTDAQLNAPWDDVVKNTIVDLSGTRSNFKAFSKVPQGEEKKWNDLENKLQTTIAQSITAINVGRLEEEKDAMQQKVYKTAPAGTPAPSGGT